MKIKLIVDVSFVSNLGDQEFIIDWPINIIPRIGESMFIDDIIPQPLPFKENQMWRVWSIDWRYIQSAGSICPVIWLEHQEQK